MPLEDRPPVPVYNNISVCSLQNVTDEGVQVVQDVCRIVTNITYEPARAASDEPYPSPFQQITCNDCGQRASDVVGVDIGGRPCTDVRSEVVGSAIQVRCRAPPGTGTRVPLTVHLLGGSGQWRDFEYRAPVLTSVSPPNFLQGSPDNYTGIEIHGSGFGPSDSQLQQTYGANT